ncbi:MAG: TetR family transcriptional regulator [Myxococcota bacterium]|nr:TetR family transcriptional regulator [Myxococcota bacterium]
MRATTSDGRPRSADKSERILRAAIRVFARKGFYAARVSDIARAAGVADGTIYLYFRNKEHVLVRIFEDRLGKLLDVLRARLVALPTVEERVRAVVVTQLGLLEDQRDLAEVVTVNMRQSSRLLRRYAAPLFQRYLDLVAAVFAEGQQAGRIRSDLSPRVAARALWGALDGLALTWALADGDPARLRRAADQLAELVLRGALSPAPREPVLDTSRRGA